MWTLESATSADDVPVPLDPDHPILLVFGGVEVVHAVVAGTGCNDFFAEGAMILNGRLELKNPSMTARGCVSPIIAEREHMLDGLLASRPTVEIAGDLLTLRGLGKAVYRGASTNSTVTVSRGSCVAEPTTTRFDVLVLEITPPTTCDNEHGGILRITNTGSTTYSSGIMALIGQVRMWSESLSGYGGEHGSWQPMPTSYAEVTGVNLYPPGSRQWDLVPTVAAGWGLRVEVHPRDLLRWSNGDGEPPRNDYCDQRER